MSWLLLVVAIMAQDARVDIRVPLNAATEVDVGEVIHRLAAVGSFPIEPLPSPLKLPMAGLAAPLTRAMLGETLGPDASVEVVGNDLLVRIDPSSLNHLHRPEFERRVRDLAARAAREVDRGRVTGSGRWSPTDPTTRPGRRSA